MKEKVLVSACLCGINCRWHGKKVYPSKKVKALLAEWEAEPVIVCPETMGGLPVPRPPVKRRKGRVFETCPDKAERKNVTGKEVTDAFRLGAEKALSICLENGIRRAILCSYSPSCDKRGLTGSLLEQNGITVINVFRSAALSLL